MLKTFNKIYYAKADSTTSSQKVGIDSFFYPLDQLHHWNRIYGKKGFIQYQFVLPESNSYAGLEKILQKINKSNFDSFLTVLKRFGKENENYLSFPMRGYSLALDFKMQQGLSNF